MERRHDMNMVKLANNLLAKPVMPQIKELSKTQKVNAKLLEALEYMLLEVEAEFGCACAFPCVKLAKQAIALAKAEQ